MNESFNIIGLIKLMLRWWKQILIVCLIAIASSITISLLLPNYYESMVLFFPSNPALTDRQNLYRTDAGDEPVSFFGKEKDADRLLQIGKSAQLAAYIIYKYDLFKHYDIDSSNSKYPQYEVNKEFEDNYQIFRNEYGAIEIHIMDVNKDLAAKMANDIVDKIDEINNLMVVNNKKEVLDIFDTKLKEKQEALDQITKELTNIKIESNQSKQNKTVVEERIKNLEEIRSAAVKDLNITSTLRAQYETAANKTFSSVYILERAYPAEKKVKPIRWLIVVSSFLITLLVSVLTIAIIEKVKTVDWKN